MRFVEHDFGGALVHDMLDDRVTHCAIDTKYYNASPREENACVTCILCIAKKSRRTPLRFTGQR